MECRTAFLAVLSASLLWAAPAAADLPPIRTSERNAVPECATPGRMMAFLRARNDKLEPRFEKIAVEYMRHGEELGLRWDYAFFQMVIETGYLTFKRDGNRHGLVKPQQNNFAGLGATGKGESGESFKDMQTGVLAHLQHLLMYTGEVIDNPVAERTRKVMEWRVLDAWRNKIKGSMTFAHLAQRWAMSSEYADAIGTHGDRFYGEFCGKPDPNPELVQEARAGSFSKPTAEAPTEAKPKGGVSGVELARQAIVEGKAEGSERRSGLGGALLAKAGDTARAENVADPREAKDAGPSAGYTLLNAPKAEDEGRSEGASKSSDVQTASVAGTLAKKPLAPPAAKCRVWTASYGGQKAVLIRAQAEGAVNYTVLDVNEGTEKREADAYIAAYAKGGAVAGEFQSQSQALDKAFELCPEG